MNKAGVWVLEHPNREGVPRMTGRRNHPATARYAAGLSLAFLLLLPSTGGAQDAAASRTPPQVDILTRSSIIEAVLAERDRQYAQRFDAQEKAVQAALAAAKEAVLKAEASSEKRFEAVNEFRSTLKDQQANLITRNEVDIRFKALENSMTILGTRIAENTARSAGVEWLWGVIVGGVGLVVGVVSALFAYQRSKAKV